mmetsp:Transcript_18909/g.44936  ORF Transcript_18909/g.44936 Transcript_18909/m.44936 type:complete len:380 (+) Transcript_18909:57-1196(+)
MLHHERVWARATSGGPQPQRVPLLTGDRPHVVPSAVGSRAHVVWGEGASSGRLPSTALRRLVLGLGHVARADLLAREPAARHASHAGGRARLVDKLHVDEAGRGGLDLGRDDRAVLAALLLDVLLQVVEELGVALLVLAVGVEHVLHQHAEAWRRDGARVHPHHAGHAAHAHHPSHAPHAAERREPHAAAHHRRGHGRRVLHELHDELLAGELEAVDRLLRVLGVRGVDVRDVGDAEARLRRGVLHERHLGELAKGREDLAHVRLGDVRVQLRDHELGRLGRRTHAHHLVGRLRVLGRLRQPVLLRHARLHEQRLALEGDAVERERLHDRLGVAELDVPHALGLARALVADQPDVAHAARLREELENLEVVGARVNPLH